MKKLTKSALKLLVIGTMLIPGISQADFKSDIIDSCEAYQQGKDTSEINSCKLYIDGFIDASILSESATVQSKIDESTDKKTSSSNFVSRAYKFRVNNSVSKATEVTYQFCIPNGYDRKIIASTTAKAIDIKQLAEKQLKLVVLETLMSTLPCQK